jgi:DNA-binding PadR family transcriptional regulator
MKDKTQKDFFQRISEANLLHKEKMELIGHYYPPSQGVIYYLLLKLTKEQIRDICEKYALKEEYKLEDFKEELKELCGYETGIFGNPLNPKKKVAFSSLEWREQEYRCAFAC